MASAVPLLSHVLPPPDGDADIPPQPRKWTRQEFYRLAELGFFEGQRAERLEGDIMVLSPPKWLHASTTDRVADVLRTAFGAEFWVRMQLPLALQATSDPEPDVSVVPGSRASYSDHPTGAALMVEVADTSLALDRGRKAQLYAAAGLADYWIVNLAQRQLEIYRDPQPEPMAPGQWRYTTLSYLAAGQSIAPLARPEAMIAVVDLLP